MASSMVKLPIQIPNHKMKKMSYKSQVKEQPSSRMPIDRTTAQTQSGIPVGTSM